MTIPYPPYTNELDYELEIAVVIGRPGRDIRPRMPSAYLRVYDLRRTSSAHDIQREEMKVSAGPAKGKDFALHIGTLHRCPQNELANQSVGRPGIYDLMMRACVNGQGRRIAGNFKDMYWSFEEILARASKSGAASYPGDVIGSGTVGTGCLLEITKAQGPWLNKGNVVALEINVSVSDDKGGN